MLKTISRLEFILHRGVTHHQTLSQAFYQNQFRCLASFRTKEFTHQTSDGEGAETLVTRFTSHVASQTKLEGNCTSNVDEIFTFDIQKELRDRLKELSVDDVRYSIYAARSKRSELHPNNFCTFVNQIDDECSRRIDELSTVELLSLLNAFMYLVPNKIAQLDFYRLAISELVKNFGGDTAGFVAVCFYLGLWKKNDLATRTMKQLLDQNLIQHIQSMSTLDLAIVCSAAFKTSVTISEDEFNDRLIDEIDEMQDEDVPLLVTFIKSCRYNRIKAQRVLNSLREKIVGGSLNSIDLRGVVHLFAYFAENLVIDEDVISFFLLRGGCYLNDGARIKDINTFLWCCAHLGLEIKDRLDLRSLSDVIHRKVRNQQYKRDEDTLISTLLSLWILGYPEPELAAEILRSVPFKKNQSRVKLDSRKIQLAACLEIETDQSVTNFKLFDPTRPAPKYLTTQRDVLQDMFNDLKNDPDVLAVELVQPIAELNIAGILVTLKTNEKVFIEVLDQTNMTSIGTPFGLLKLKLRLLEAKGQKTSLVSPKLKPIRMTIDECLQNREIFSTMESCDSKVERN